MAAVFISYRRDDSAASAGRVHDRLAREFGENLLFMDVDNVPLGSDFVKILHDAVSKCDILLAVIGRNWLDARDADGSRRLDNENDRDCSGTATRHSCGTHLSGWRDDPERSGIASGLKRAYHAQRPRCPSRFVSR
jgi:TIR domain